MASLVDAIKKILHAETRNMLNFIIVDTFVKLVLKTCASSSVNVKVTLLVFHR